MRICRKCLGSFYHVEPARVHCESCKNSRMCNKCRRRVPKHGFRVNNDGTLTKTCDECRVKQTNLFRLSTPREYGEVNEPKRVRYK